MATMATPTTSQRSHSSPFTNPFDDVDSLPRCGTHNADGTIFGGGPRDINCSACSGAGLPAEYGHGHRKGQRSFCPVLQRMPTAKAIEKQLDPLLKRIADDSMPVDTTKSVVKPGADMMEALKAMEGVPCDDVLLHLAEGKISAPQAKLALIKSMKDADSD